MENFLTVGDILEGMDSFEEVTMYDTPNKYLIDDHAQSMHGNHSRIENFIHHCGFNEKPCHPE